MENIYNNEIPTDNLKETLKLYKNSRGYNWDIKLLEINIDRIMELNAEMQKRFGSSE